MAELLIVIALIVLLLGLAVPAFNLLSGGRSIEGATNQISAALGRARAEAIGLQKVTGLMFFIDPRSQRRTVAIVQQVDPVSDHANSGVDVWLDVVEDSDFLPLPAGIGVQVIDDTTVNSAGARTNDGYIGFNFQGRAFTDPVSSSPSLSAVSNASTSTAYGGVLLFDGSGQMTVASYGFRGVVTNGAGAPIASRLGQLLFGSGVAQDFAPGPANGNANKSGVGLVLFEQDQFANNGDDADPQMRNPGIAYNAGELNEENWIDSNSTPLLINRYNGTLVKGE